MYHVHKDTQALVTLAQFTDYSNLDRLLAQENLYAWHRKINFFPQVTSEIERYLLYTSLPYCLNIGTNLKVMHLWPDYPFLDNLPGKQLSNSVVLPFGNMRPKYMVIGDSTGEMYNCKLFTRVTGKQGYFDRAWSRGLAARVLRGALCELHIGLETWYTTLLKRYTLTRHKSTLDDCRGHYSHIVNEVNILQPDTVIIVGKNTSEIARGIGLSDLCHSRGIRVLYARHPFTFRSKKSKPEICKEYANHLYSILF